MEKKWVIKPKISNDLIKKFPEFSPVILQLLFNRNITEQKLIDEFLSPDYTKDIHDPYLFKDMIKSVKRIKQAIDNNEKIIIHGDYDADGVCATAILLSTLKKIGAENIDIYLPHREKEGYGLNMKTIEFFHEEKVNLIITCDCGVSNYQEIKKANNYGIDTVITDHHQEPKILPEAVAIINPVLKGENYPFKGLAGAGVAFKFAQALLQDYDKQNQMVSAKGGRLLKRNGGQGPTSGWEKWLLDLVAIGTVADVSSLIGENRTLVKYGLVVLQKTKRLGLQKLFAVAGINLDKMNTYTIGYQISPRINSAGRVDHANTAFKLIATDNIEEAIILATELNKNNQERQKITDQIFQEALNIAKEQIKDQHLLIAANENWNPGVIGLVAGKVCQEFHRPTFIFSIENENYTASGRSVPEFNIIEAVNSQADLLERFGGHPSACGLTVKKINYEKLIKNLRQLANDKLKNLELMPSLFIDAEIELNDLNWDLAQILEDFEPHGENNPKPKFITRNLQVNELNAVGVNAQHLKIKVNNQKGQAKKVIIFDCARVCPNLELNDKIDLVYEIIIHEWNGTKEIELNAIDIKKSR